MTDTKQIEEILSNSRGLVSRFREEYAFLSNFHKCKIKDDVYLKMTHQQYLKEFKRVIERVNERLDYIDNSQDKCERDGDTITYYPLHGYRLGVPREPVKPSEELYQSLKSLWEEIYHEN